MYFHVLKNLWGLLDNNTTFEHQSLRNKTLVMNNVQLMFCFTFFCRTAQERGYSCCHNINTCLGGSPQCGVCFSFLFFSYAFKFWQINILMNCITKIYRFVLIIDCLLLHVHYLVYVLAMVLFLELLKHMSIRKSLTQKQRYCKQIQQALPNRLSNGWS